MAKVHPRARRHARHPEGRLVRHTRARLRHYALRHHPPWFSQRRAGLHRAGHHAVAGRRRDGGVRVRALETGVEAAARFSGWRHPPARRGRPGDGRGGPPARESARASHPGARSGQAPAAGVAREGAGLLAEVHGRGDGGGAAVPGRAGVPAGAGRGGGGQRWAMGVIQQGRKGERDRG